MTDNEFDNIIKDRLQQHEAEVPTGIWQRITGAEKKRRFGYAWRRYLMVLILLLLLVSGLHIFYPAQPSLSNADKATSHASDTSQTNSNGGNIQVTGSSLPFAEVNKKYSIASIKNNNSHKILNSNLAETTQEDFARNEEQKPSINTYDQTGGDSLAATLQQKPDSLQKASKEINASDSAEVKKKNEAPDRLLIQLFVSPDFVFSRIRSDNQNYGQVLHNSIHMRVSYSIGAGVSLPITKKISLSGGIRYSRVNEVIRFEDSAAVTGNTFRNHLNFIDVPLIVTYKTALTSSFQTSVSGGILFNISSHYKGRMPDVFGGSIDIGHSVYRRNTSVSIYAGINFSKSINDRAAVFAEPYFLYQTKNITENIQPFTRKLHTAGLALGIQYGLFKNEKQE